MTITAPPADEPPPQITSGVRGKTVAPTAEGSDFRDGTKLLLTRGSPGLPNKKVPTGEYDVEVANPDGQETTLRGGFEVPKKARR